MSRAKASAAVVFTILAVFCWIQALSFAGKLQNLPNDYRLQFSGEAPLSNTQWDQLEEETAPYVLLREGEASVTALQFDRRQSLTLLEIAGDAHLLFPLQDMIVGAFPPAGEGGCVVDKATAYALWGDTNAIGKAVTWKQKDYIVAGVLDTERPLMVVHHSGRDDFAPTAAVYRPDATMAFPRQGLDDFLSGLSLSAAVTISQQRTADLMRLLTLAPAWVFCLLVAAQALRMLVPKRLYRILALAALAALSGWALGFPSIITPEMLPTRWSDFSFWRRTAEDFGDQLGVWWYLPGTLSGYLFIQAAVVPVVCWSGAALAVFLLAMHSIKNMNH